MTDDPDLDTAELVRLVLTGDAHHVQVEGAFVDHYERVDAQAALDHRLRVEDLLDSEADVLRDWVRTNGRTKGFGRVVRILDRLPPDQLTVLAGDPEPALREVYDRAVERAGGSAAVRVAGLLRAALARPVETRAYDWHPMTWEETPASRAATELDALLETGHPPVASQVRAALRDPDVPWENVRDLLAPVDRDTGAVLTTLLEELADETDLRLRRIHQEASYRRDARWVTSTPNVGRVTEDGLRHEDPLVRLRTVLREWYGEGPRDDLDLLAGVLDDPDVRVRMAAASAVPSSGLPALLDRLAVEPEEAVRERLVARIARFTAPRDGDWPGRELREEYGALPVGLASATYVWGVRPDGTVLRMELETLGHDVEQETDPLVVFAARLRAARRDPSLALLVTAPPEGARPCPACGGTGACPTCRGIGWVSGP